MDRKYGGVRIIYLNPDEPDATKSVGKRRQYFWDSGCDKLALIFNADAFRPDAAEFLNVLELDVTEWFGEQHVGRLSSRTLSAVVSSAKRLGRTLERVKGGWF